MEVTLGTFKGEKGEPFVQLIINNYTVAMKSIKDIVGHSIIAQTLHPHALYAKDDNPFIGIHTGKEVFARLHKAVQMKQETVMNYNGGNGSLKNFPWEEISRETFEVDYSTDLRELLLKKNNEVSKIYN